jgi:copper chaperone CopZ
MKQLLITLTMAAALFLPTAIVRSAEPVAQPPRGEDAVKATYLLTGLHCPPCTKTVETSLQRVEGIRSIKVDWKTKSALIEFDEAVLPAQRIAQLIAATPHMMGGAMHYGGWLALKAPGIKDEATARQAEEALGAVEGVKTVKAYPAQHTVAVFFSAKGEVKTRQLIESLKSAGIEGELF